MYIDYTGCIKKVIELQRAVLSELIEIFSYWERSGFYYYYYYFISIWNYFTI